MKCKYNILILNYYHRKISRGFRSDLKLLEFTTDEIRLIFCDVTLIDLMDLKNIEIDSISPNNINEDSELTRGLAYMLNLCRQVICIESKTDLTSQNDFKSIKTEALLLRDSVSSKKTVLDNANTEYLEFLKKLNFLRDKKIQNCSDLDLKIRLKKGISRLVEILEAYHCDWECQIEVIKKFEIFFFVLIPFSKQYDNLHQDLFNCCLIFSACMIYGLNFDNEILINVLNDLKISVPDPNHIFWLSKNLMSPKEEKSWALTDPCDLKPIR